MIILVGTIEKSLSMSCFLKSPSNYAKDTKKIQVTKLNKCV